MTETFAETKPAPVARERACAGSGLDANLAPTAKRVELVPERREMRFPPAGGGAGRGEDFNVERSPPTANRVASSFGCG